MSGGLLFVGVGGALRGWWFSGEHGSFESNSDLLIFSIVFCSLGSIGGVIGALSLFRGHREVLVLYPQHLFVKAWFRDYEVAYADVCRCDLWHDSITIRRKGRLPFVIGDGYFESEAERERFIRELTRRLPESTIHQMKV